MLSSTWKIALDRSVTFQGNGRLRLSASMSIDNYCTLWKVDKGIDQKLLKSLVLPYLSKATTKQICVEWVKSKYFKSTSTATFSMIRSFSGHMNRLKMMKNPQSNNKAV